VTIGAKVGWDGGTGGRAVGVSAAGGLLVETGEGLVELASGAVRHLREVSE
jgi:hypothetical protein